MAARVLDLMRDLRIVIQRRRDLLHKCTTKTILRRGSIWFPTKVKLSRARGPTRQIDQAAREGQHEHARMQGLGLLTVSTTRLLD